MSAPKPSVPEPVFHSKEGDGSTSLQGLHAFLHTLRSNGVRVYQGALDKEDSIVKVEFFPSEPIQSSSPPLDTKADPECECGHVIADHNSEGECLHQSCVEAKKCTL